MPKRTHVVRFYSPGTLFSEVTEEAIDAWLPTVAAAMAKGIRERHGATPYGFQFATRLTADPISDGEGGMLEVESKEVATSGMHFLGGRILRYEDIPAVLANRTCRSNMRGNRIPLVVENQNSYRSTMPFNEKDVIVDEDGECIQHGSHSQHVEYRDRTIRLWEDEDRLARSWAKEPSEPAL